MVTIKWTPLEYSYWLLTEVMIFFLIFIGPCIVIYSYSTTNKMHLLSQIIYSCKTLYIFRTVFPSIIRSSKLRIQHRYVSNSCCYLLLSGMRWNSMEFQLLPAAIGDEMELHGVPAATCCYQGWDGTPWSSSCYLLLSGMRWNSIEFQLLLAAIGDEMELHGVPAHPR